ncbi:hypothetical protein ACLOJK_036490 [Asimina triloba]
MSPAAISGHRYYQEGRSTPSRGVPLQRSDGLPKVGNAALKELETGQRMILKFFQSHNLKWYSSNGVEERRLGETSGSSVDAGPLTGGSLVLTPYRSNLRACEEERLRKKKCLAKVGHEGKRFTILDNEEERLARQEEVDLQAGLTLSCEETHHSSLVIVSLKVAIEPIHLRLTSLSSPMMDIKEGALSLAPSFEKESSKTLVREA